MMLNTILLVAAVVCLFLAAFGVSVKGVQVGWLGLALFVLAGLV
jgi:hypothetical protein